MHLHIPEHASDASRASQLSASTRRGAVRRSFVRFFATLMMMLVALLGYDIATAARVEAQASPATTAARPTATTSVAVGPAAGTPSTVPGANVPRTTISPGTTIAPGTPGAPTGPTATIVAGTDGAPALPAGSDAIRSGQRTGSTPLTAGSIGGIGGTTSTTPAAPLSISGQSSTTPALTFDDGVPISSSTTAGSLSLSIGDPAKPSQSLLIIVLLTLLSVAPSLLILLTSFTRIAIVLSLVRNALGLQSIPPNQVIVGLALFLSLFVMRPTLDQMNKDALQPLLRGEKTQGQAYDAAMVPMRAFMLKQTGTRELKMMIAAAKEEKPATTADVSTATLIPAFILSELRIAFIIGFVVFIPFLVIDLVVSSSLMSMGMMMLPPVVISLPFKLLLFVMVDGWALVVRSLIKSFG